MVLPLYQYDAGVYFCPVGYILLMEHIEQNNKKYAISFVFSVKQLIFVAKKQNTNKYGKNIGRTRDRNE